MIQQALIKSCGDHNKRVLSHLAFDLAVDAGRIDAAGIHRRTILGEEAEAGVVAVITEVIAHWRRSAQAQTRFRVLREVGSDQFGVVAESVLETFVVDNGAIFVARVAVLTRVWIVTVAVAILKAVVGLVLEPGEVIARGVRSAAVSALGQSHVNNVVSDAGADAITGIPAVIRID